jgi:hypothetical protein
MKMSPGLSIQVLGTLRAGVCSPCPPQPCWFFRADRVAIGSQAWSDPALVLHDSTVSPRHALVEKSDHNWVVRDMDSDNGIRSVRFATGAADRLEDSRQAFRLEFSEELCCCVGAVVLRFKTFK